MKCKEAHFLTEIGRGFFVLFCFLHHPLWYQYPNRVLSVEIQQLFRECVCAAGMKTCGCVLLRLSLFFSESIKELV